MKKLLLLGGSRYLLPVIDAAHSLDCYVITCDYIPSNIAHKYSDEYCNISIVDKEAVLELAKRMNIDGIMSFACDPGVVTAAYVAEKLGLPSSGPYESVCILQNKWKFRKFLADHGFNVPNAKSYSRVEDALKEQEGFHWPVIVKPVDSAGSKGVSRVDGPEELKRSIHKALQFSQSKEFIIEDFLESKKHPSDSECFSMAGTLKFVSFSAQRFDITCENPYTPAAFSWSPTISEHNQKELAGELQRLLRLLNMGTSLYNVETRECTDGKAYIMECSPRGGGNRLAEMIRYSFGIDLILRAVQFAIGEPVSAIVQNSCISYWAEIILHSDKYGMFKDICISDAIQENVVEMDIWVSRGEKVDCFSGANKAIGTLILKFETEEKMNEVLDHQAQYVQINIEGSDKSDL